MHYLQIEAPAKINLHLSVGQPLSLRGKQAQGPKATYHPVKTLMHSISLCDSIELAASSEACPSLDEILISIDGKFSCPLEDNLITRAARLYLNRLGAAFSLNSYPKNLHFKVEKRIPQEAGLGGGSSDAAACLSLLERLAREFYPEIEALGYRSSVLDKEELLAIAAELGSDVSFFLYGGCAWGLAYGEDIQPEPRAYQLSSALSRFPMLLIHSADYPCPTGKMYQQLDQRVKSDLLPADHRHFINTLLESNQKLIESDPKAIFSLLKNNFCNDFQKPAEEYHSGLAKLSQFLYSSHSLSYGLSGSGSAYYAFFASQRDLQSLTEQLHRAFGRIFQTWELALVGPHGQLSFS